MVGGWKRRSKRGHGTCLNVRALSCLLLSLANVSKASRSIPQRASRGSISDLRTYALLLLEPDSVALSDAFPSTRVATMDEQELHGSAGGLTGCREAVEVLTRVPKKVSYDVNKDGVKVAVLTFMKSAWRLGETVLGVVELNDREGRARILKAGGISFMRDPDMF